ncbi:nuclear transport factor 2 family protein [Labilibaculum sp. K2S]|uniref:nuclear transport factor 2 family protein n=1 Tax=Labilibaculum sp. K2S TaxID=3056386 RepID=UPI0025A3C1A4|nr:nuclear transport factor 2 family protein [Labilibaculum sp. K2S]MDM8160565.1 nuclear transport factor 2 family protein [Labilibaculum sp. K2S]
MHKLSLILGLLFILISGSCSTSVSPQNKEVDEFINKWHKTAAEAELTSYFDMMSENAVYIGTDAGERWTKKEFFAFCKPHFLKGKTWDFKPFDRQIYFSDDHKTIWFDELLNTWMGVCRGSGVIVLENGELKISHYHLSVTIKNEKMNEFLRINQE